jgi:hypothetical protein
MTETTLPATYRVLTFATIVCTRGSSLGSWGEHIHTVEVRMPTDWAVVQALWDRGYRPVHREERYCRLGLHGMDAKLLAAEREWLAELGLSEEREG